MARILLIEDEEGLREVISLNLELEGYEVIARGDAIHMVEVVKSESPDLVLLDVMLPGIDGFEACRHLREAQQEVPVIFITARGESEDRIRGLKTGGDDYLVKPFSLEELILRVKNLLKRSGGRSGEVFRFGDNVINFRAYTCSAGGVTHKLSKREADLLRILVSRKNEVVSRDEILERLWPDGKYPSPRVIDNLILGFRKIFEKEGEPSFFQSIRGVGYQFTPSEKV